MSGRRSERSRKTVDYAKFGGVIDEDDEDFQETKLPKRAKISIENNDKPSKNKKNGSISNSQEKLNTSKEHLDSEKPKKRIPLEEKILQRQISQVLELSKAGLKPEAVSDDKKSKETREHFIEDDIAGKCVQSKSEKESDDRKHVEQETNIESEKKHVVDESDKESDDKEFVASKSEDESEDDDEESCVDNSEISDEERNKKEVEDFPSKESSSEDEKMTIKKLKINNKVVEPVSKVLAKTTNKEAPKKPRQLPSAKNMNDKIPTNYVSPVKTSSRFMPSKSLRLGLSRKSVSKPLHTGVKPQS